MPSPIQSIAPLRPDDLRPNVYVVILSSVRELRRCAYCDFDAAARNTRGEVLAERTRDTSFAGEPLRVICVALPHLLVERPGGQTITLDLRQSQLGVLPARYGFEATKRLAASYVKHGDPRTPGTCDDDED
jgi:hypothetical protein